MHHPVHVVDPIHQTVKRSLCLCLGCRKHFSQTNYPTYRKKLQMDCWNRRIEQMWPADHHGIDMKNYLYYCYVHLLCLKKRNVQFKIDSEMKLVFNVHLYFLLDHLHHIYHKCLVSSCLKELRTLQQFL